MLKRFILVALACLAVGVQAFAQNAVTGKVVDEKGEPVIGAAVQIKGSNTGVATDLDGLFSIRVSDNGTLVISSIGYKTVELAVKGQKSLSVVLEEDTLFLDDVVVVGYGTARKKDVSGAISSVNYGNDSNVSSLPNPNALAALSSKVAGLNYAPTSSASGDSDFRCGMFPSITSGRKTASYSSPFAPCIVSSETASSPPPSGSSPPCAVPSPSVSSIASFRHSPMKLFHSAYVPNEALSS